jgi:hypothetical protein
MLAPPLKGHCPKSGWAVRSIFREFVGAGRDRFVQDTVLLNAVALENAVCGGVGFCGVEDQPLKGIALAELKQVKAVLGRFFSEEQIL